MLWLTQKKHNDLPLGSKRWWWGSLLTPRHLLLRDRLVPHFLKSGKECVGKGGPGEALICYCGAWTLKAPLQQHLSLWVLMPQKVCLLFLSFPKQQNIIFAIKDGIEQ